MTDEITMPAVAYLENLPIGDRRSLIDVTLPIPEPGEYDLLVKVHAVSVNPVDTKVRMGTDPGGEPRVLGYDAAGVVVATGPAVTAFSVGDEVYYAGSIARPGTNSQFHLVSEQIVGLKPAGLSFAEAAALPLTGITAWECLFERLALTAESTGTLLVLPGAGGVGSMVIQLARALTKLTVIATASRPDSEQWAAKLGADHVVDHHGDLAAAVAELAPDGVDYVFTAHSAGNIDAFAQLTRPFGAIVAIDDPAGLDLMPLKSKSISWHWELMFTKPLYLPGDASQRDILRRITELVDAGTIRTTMTRELSPIEASTLREAHELIESGTGIGKVVVSAESSDG